MLGYVKYGSFVTHRVSFANEKQKNEILLALRLRRINGEVVDTSKYTANDKALMPKADMSYKKFKEVLRKENQ